MSRLVTVANITSFSYSGTTWLNLLLGCHPRAAALGPSSRVADLFAGGESDGSDACRVHGAECSFWPRFFREADRKGNFYVQVAEMMGKDVLVINNPHRDSRAMADLRHRDVQLRSISCVRDGRGVVSSYLRYFPDQDMLDVMRDWFRPFAAQIPFDPGHPDILSLRYEDAVADPHALAAAAGRFLDLDYSQDFLRYWEFEHHLIGCNPGPLAILRRHLGLPLAQRTDTEAIEQRYQRLLADPGDFTVERPWEKDWGDRERLLFDWFGGDYNERWGYERDRFTVRDVQEFEADLGGERPEPAAAFAAPAAPGALPPRLDRLLNAIDPRTAGSGGPALRARKIRRLALVTGAGWLLTLGLGVLLGSLL